MSLQQNISMSHAESLTAIDDQSSEGEESVNSFEMDRPQKKKHNEYISTNLITGRNLTLADVQTDVLDKKAMMQKISQLSRNGVFRVNTHGMIDPRTIVKTRMKSGFVTPWFQRTRSWSCVAKLENSLWDCHPDPLTLTIPNTRTLL